MQYSHTAVMSEEVIHYLKPKSGGKFIDCTLGGGGHSSAILERISPTGELLSIDLDSTAITAAKEQTKKYKNKIFVQDSFKNIKKIAHVHKFNKINGILFDLGLSSGQLQDHSRGFSFLSQGNLDMRFGTSSSEGEEPILTAETILNSYSQQQLHEIFKKFGEEKLAQPISKKIIEFRKQHLISSPEELVEIITEVYKKYYKGKSKINPATKVFQALRIAVNDELESLAKALPDALNLLSKGGRIVVISYHSLEDKIVKEFFKLESRDCICDPQNPTCQCKHKKTLKIVTKKPIMATDQEVAENPRSRSAKLRVAERV
ncbi:MAG: 16S rRNA (cytosine(1402)-N(4))-methyltransferase [Parcubacteria group bacterium]|jgi:16S rRNA (cytosine1402-N4)-methyltransferase|nr:16S rRNA (cytosine(1402)-N(4))-methyltransferase [Parcubacteria group bacterium]|tara:strand:+ start:6837 stop:7790 length:954 start_codon:yes stop_codon:yes gene_type:complete